jgi:transcriptional regulator with XRE-family HTH domain
MIPTPGTALARVIRDRRRALGFSQAEVAAKLAVAERTLRRWEAGESAPRDRHVEALAAFLEVAPAQIVMLAGLPVDSDTAATWERLDLIRDALDGFTREFERLVEKVDRAGGGR